MKQVLRPEANTELRGLDAAHSAVKSSYSRTKFLPEAVSCAQCTYKSYSVLNIGSSSNKFKKLNVTVALGKTVIRFQVSAVKTLLIV